MAARSKQRRNSRKLVQPLRPENAVGLLAGVVLFSLLLQNASLLVDLLAPVGLCAAIIWAIRSAWVRRADGRLHDRLIYLINEHENALIATYRQSRLIDAFGTLDDHKWRKQIDLFLRTKVIPGRTDFAVWRQSPAGQRAAQIVAIETETRIEAARRRGKVAPVEVGELSPIDYERYCANLLGTNGWAIQMTPATRDGGADFIAEKGGHRIVAQCKRYTKPVGNKAVQEANAAVRLYNGTAACVVAPSGYTTQASREALGLSVALLHHSDLPVYAERLTSGRT